MARILNNKRVLATVLTVVFVCITFATGALAVFGRDDFAIGKSSADDSSASVGISSSNASRIAGEPAQNLIDEIPEPVDRTSMVFDRPDEMRAVFASAGNDFLLGSSPTEQSIKADIDKMLDKMTSLMLNTVIIDTKYKDTSIYHTDYMPKASPDFDILEYFLTKAKEKNIYTYIFVDALDVPEGNKIVTRKTADAQVLDFLANNVKQLTQKYDFTGILIDTYYNPYTESSYADYIKNGGSIGFENYMKQMPHAIVSTISRASMASNPKIQVGIISDSVWENKSANAQGSNTSASFTTLSGGNADVKAFIEEGLADFVMVKAYGSLSDKAVPFTNVVNWWAAVANSKNIPLYVVHSSDKAATGASGYGSPDQLTKQIIEARKISGYKGSVFNSYTKFIADPGQSTTAVVKLFRNEINTDFILKELQLTNPTKTQFTTFEPKTTFMGASDPNFDATMNGKPISRDGSGYFSIEAELKPGINEFSFVHKGKTITYKITRQTQILKEIAPVGSVTVEGGMKIKITANAYDGSTVTATLNGISVKLSPAETDNDSTDRDSNYKTYVGTYTAPKATSSVQQLGNIVVKATWQGMSESKTGAAVSVNKLGATGPLVQVTAEQAVTYPIDSLGRYPDGDNYPLPQGTLDYIVGDAIVYKEGNEEYTYYKLQSNMRVATSDVSRVEGSLGGNTISGMSVENDGQYTKIILNTQQKVSFTPSYSSSAFTINFHNTTSVPSSMSLSKTPLFDSANWSGSELTLKLAKSNGFIGYKAYYDSSDNLVFRFNNPPSSVAGARIVIDPGHSVADPGALGFLSSYPEQVINQGIASQLLEILQGMGASVKLINTQGGAVSLESRVKQASSFNPQIFVSIHNNSSTSSSAKGTEAYYFYPFSSKLASLASSYVSSELSTTNRGGKYGQYYVTRTPEYAAILAECGFVTNKSEYEKLITSNYQANIAEGLAKAIAGYISAVNSGSSSTGSEVNGVVKSVSVTGVTIKSSTTLQAGSSETLTPTITPSNASNKNVTFTSSNKAVATVDSNGTVTAVSPGTATITVKTADGGKTDTCTVTVTAKPIPVTDVSLDKSSISLNVGSTAKVTATVSPSNATNKACSYSSTNPSVADVDQNGNITAKAAGSAVIVAKTQDGELTAECTVKVTTVGASS